MSTSGRQSGDSNLEDNYELKDILKQLFDNKPVTIDTLFKMVSKFMFENSNFNGLFFFLQFRNHSMQTIKMNIYF